jgi:hypothetical protein
MAKYRLTWTGDGSLDLSQVPDDRGVPIVFTKKGAEAVVDEGSYRHPLVQRCLKSGLEATSLESGVVQQAPAPPKAPAVPKTAPEPKAPAEPPKETPKVEVADKVTMTERLSVTPTSTAKAEDTAAKDAGEKDEPAPSKPKAKGRKGRSK